MPPGRQLRPGDGPRRVAPSRHDDAAGCTVTNAAGVIVQPVGMEQTQPHSQHR